MKKNLFGFLLLFLLVGGLSACGLLQEPAEPSATIEAVPLDIEEADESAEVAAPTAESEEPPVEIDEAEESEEEMVDEVAEEEMVDEAAEEEMAEEEAEDAASSAAELTIYEISQDSSEVRFELDEDLRGNRITVVGTTDQVAGQIAINLSDLSTAQVGVIQINARALSTDNDFRNRAIQNEILLTGDYEFITFTPTAVNGLPDSASVGEFIEFTIEGELTIRDVTETATFDVTATAVTETALQGTATATVLRDAYGLNIPEVPSVANVENEVDLIITFIANAS